MSGHNWPAPSFAPDPYDYIENPPTSSQRRVVEQPASYRFYFEAEVGKTEYENPDVTVVDQNHEVIFIDSRVGNFEASRIFIINDGPEDILFSYDGVHDHGRLKPSESIMQNERRERRVFLRLAERSENSSLVRIYAW